MFRWLRQVSARRRLRRMVKHGPRTDDPLVGRTARWLGGAGLPAAFDRIPVGAVGAVRGWQVANRDRHRQYLIDFDFNGGGVTYQTALPVPEIELV